MISHASLGKEIEINVKNRVGTLAGISKVLADSGINIEAICGSVKGSNLSEGEIVLVTDDNRRSSDGLKEAGYDVVQENEVVVVELGNKPGALKSLTKILATENIDIIYVYGTICQQSCPAKIILNTDNNEKAVVILSNK